MILEILKGMATTFKHLFRKPVTVSYPEERLPLAPRYRGLHMLVVNDDGMERCVGCELCAIACPADAIYIEPAENTEQERRSRGERYARVYKIHMLRCIFCGYCEEACPEEAVVMGKKYEIASYNRGDFVYGKERLMMPLKEALKQRPDLHPDW